MVRLYFYSDLRRNAYARIYYNETMVMYVHDIYNERDPSGE